MHVRREVRPCARMQNNNIIFPVPLRNLKCLFEEHCPLLAFLQTLRKRYNPTTKPIYIKARFKNIVCLDTFFNVLIIG